MEVTALVEMPLLLLNSLYNIHTENLYSNFNSQPSTVFAQWRAHSGPTPSTT